MGVKLIGGHTKMQFKRYMLQLRYHPGLDNETGGYQRRAVKHGSEPSIALWIDQTLSNGQGAYAVNG